MRQTLSQNPQPRGRSVRQHDTGASEECVAHIHKDGYPGHQVLRPPGRVAISPSVPRTGPTHSRVADSRDHARQGRRHDKAARTPRCKRSSARHRRRRGGSAWRSTGHSNRSGPSAGRTIGHRFRPIWTLPPTPPFVPYARYLKNRSPWIHIRALPLPETQTPDANHPRRVREGARAGRRSLHLQPS